MYKYNILPKLSGFVVWLGFAFVFSIPSGYSQTEGESFESNSNLKGTLVSVQILTSEMKPAPNCKIYAIDPITKIKPLKLQKKWNRKSEKELTIRHYSKVVDSIDLTKEVKEKSIFSVKSDKKGRVKLPIGFAFLMFSEFENDVAFVPPEVSVSKSFNQVVMKPMGKVSVQLEPISGDTKDEKGGIVLVRWKNCLAGALPVSLRQHRSNMNVVDSRLTPFFEIIAIASIEQAKEIDLPPGEIEVSYISHRQSKQLNLGNAEHLASQDFLSRIHCNNGIHLVRSSKNVDKKTTQIKLRKTPCLYGKIDGLSEFPSWKPTYPQNPMLVFGIADPMPSRFVPKDPNETVRLLTNPMGRKLREIGRAGVTPTVVAEDGTFKTFPIPQGRYQFQLFVPENNKMKLIEFSGADKKIMKRKLETSEIKEDVEFVNLGSIRMDSGRLSLNSPSNQDSKETKEESGNDSEYEEESEVHLPQLVSMFSSIKSPKDRDAIRNRIRLEVEKKFDRYMLKRKKEITLLEQELKSAKKLLQSRDLNREKIVQRKINDLLRASAKKDSGSKQAKKTPEIEVQSSAGR